MVKLMFVEKGGTDSGLSLEITPDLKGKIEQQINIIKQMESDVVKGSVCLYQMTTATMDLLDLTKPEINKYSENNNSHKKQKQYK